MNKKNILTYGILIVSILIVIVYIVCYSSYSNLQEDFEPDSYQINNLNNFDPSNSANKVLTNNNYVSVLSEAYNKLVLNDETQIKNLYNDAIKQSNIIKELSKTNRKNKEISKTFPPNSQIKTIKSKNNSQYLSTLVNDIENNYGIQVNDKCLTVSGTCTGSPYCLQNCQNSLYISDSQKFYNTTIQTDADAIKIMGNDVQMSSNIVYPFNIFRSSVDDTCLAMSDIGLTLEKCNLNDIRHHWQISPDENICLLE